MHIIYKKNIWKVSKERVKERVKERLNVNRSLGNNPG